MTLIALAADVVCGRLLVVILSILKLDTLSGAPWHLYLVLVCVGQDLVNVEFGLTVPGVAARGPVKHLHMTDRAGHLKDLRFPVLVGLPHRVILLHLNTEFVEGLIEILLLLVGG